MATPQNQCGGSSRFPLFPPPSLLYSGGMVAHHHSRALGECASVLRWPRGVRPNKWGMREDTMAGRQDRP